MLVTTLFSRKQVIISLMYHVTYGIDPTLKNYVLLTEYFYVILQILHSVYAIEV